MNARMCFAPTEGHTDGLVTPPSPAAGPLDSAEGFRHVDTTRLCRHRAMTDAEAAAAEQLRRETVERLADDQISARCWLLWGATCVGTLLACYFFPAPWGYGWQP